MNLKKNKQDFYQVFQSKRSLQMSSFWISKILSQKLPLIEKVKFLPGATIPEL